MKPATCLEECIVGPNLKERKSETSSWETPISPKRKRGETNLIRSTEDTFQHAVQTFLSSGCCIIPNALPSEFLSKAKQKATSDLSYLGAHIKDLKQHAISLQDPHLLSLVARKDFREIIDRDGGRRDVRFQLDRYPFTTGGLIYNSIVFPLVQELLGDKDSNKKENVNLLYTGVMWALPPSPNEKRIHQKWHADGGHLFYHEQLPPHCINVFYPLVDITPENGPTEVQTGTHDLSYSGKTSNIPLCCKAGDAIIFDYRLQHRGNANFSKISRPILYLCYAKTWFRDAGNTRSEHSLFQSLGKAHRPSPPWISRILRGNAVKFGEGFEKDSSESTANNKTVSKSKISQRSQNNMSTGSGERWILFKMNIELPGCDIPKILTIHYGDVPLEVSSIFCKENQIADDFIPILAETINAQMNSIPK